MKIKVIEFEPKFNCHKCEMPSRYPRKDYQYLDLFVGADMPENETNESVVGKSFEIEEVGTFLGFAMGLKPVEKQEDKQDEGSK